MKYRITRIILKESLDFRLVWRSGFLLLETLINMLSTTNGTRVYINLRVHTS